MTVITQIAFGGQIYSTPSQIIYTGMNGTAIQPNDVLVAVYDLSGEDVINQFLALQGTAQQMSLQLANGNWINNVPVNLRFFTGKPVGLVLGGAPLGLTLPGRWNIISTQQSVSEHIILVITVGGTTPVPLFAPKVVASIY